MIDASDRRSIRSAEKAARLADRNRGEVLTQIASTLAGREWLWNLLESLHCFGTPIGADPYQTYFLLGEQNAGKRLLSDIMEWCPDQFLLMQREANGRRTESATRTATPERAGGEDAGRDDEGRGDDSPAEGPGFDPGSTAIAGAISDYADLYNAPARANGSDRPDRRA